jgi:riboflavin synthase
MFSGIVEATGSVVSQKKADGVVRIEVEKPLQFNDLKAGDSIAVNGICLTLENFNASRMTFALAAETLQVLGMKLDDFLRGPLNLERSLRFGDRIHGHLVSGHVDNLGEIKRRQWLGESLYLDVLVEDVNLPYVWKKGGITLNGTSLTVNDVNGALISVCLIPETLKRTNLGDVLPGQFVTVEPDFAAKAVVRNLQLKGIHEKPV